MLCWVCRRRHATRCHAVITPRCPLHAIIRHAIVILVNGIPLTRSRATPSILARYSSISVSCSSLPTFYAVNTGHTPLLIDIGHKASTGH